VAAGMVTRSQLRGPRFRRLFPDVYLPANATPALAMRSRGAYLLSLSVGRWPAIRQPNCSVPGSRLGMPTPR
jgi:hypothetical protein